MWTYNYTNTNELMHYGILGMKWGVRKDYRSSGSGKRKQSSQEDWSDDAKEASRINKKRVNQMSNAELRKLNERQNLERQHSQLNPGVISKGMKYATTAATLTGTALALYANSDKIIKLGKNIAQTIIKANKVVPSQYRLPAP